MVSVRFCDEYQRFGNRISYIYRQGFRSGNLTKNTFHVIINGTYWDFVFDTKTHEVQFNDSDSHSAPLFTDNYSGAV